MAEADPTPAETALRLSKYLAKVRERIEAGGGENPDPQAAALSVVSLTLQAAIMNHKLPQFAAHCIDFIERESKGERLFPDLDPPDFPQAN